MFVPLDLSPSAVDLIDKLYQVHKVLAWPTATINYRQLAIALSQGKRPVFVALVRPELAANGLLTPLSLQLDRVQSCVGDMGGFLQALTGCAHHRRFCLGASTIDAKLRNFERLAQVKFDLENTASSDERLLLHSLRSRYGQGGEQLHLSEFEAQFMARDESFTSPRTLVVAQRMYNMELFLRAREFKNFISVMQWRYYQALFSYLLKTYGSFSFIDLASETPDESLQIFYCLREINPEASLLRLSRNVGHWTEPALEMLNIF